LGVAHALPTNTVAVTLAGTLDLNGNNQTVIGLNGNGTVLNTSPTTAELRFGAGSSGTFTGVIADGGPGLLTVYKTGGGTQTLTGHNTFSGGSGNNGDTWQVGSDTALGSGPISMAFTAALSSDSIMPHTLANSLSFTGTSVMTLGNAANNGVLTFSGPVSFTGGTRNVAFNSDVIFTGNLDNGALNKQGNGTMTMNGTASYTGNTVIQSGTLAGNGSFAGLVQIYAAATLSPGTGIGTMTLTSNLFLNVSSTTYMEVNAANSTCDRVQGLFKVTYQGTLEVTNLAGEFTNGQTFQLFSAANVAANNFAATNLPALTSGLMWNWNPSSGTLSVVPAMATTPTNISFTVSGSTLSLTWPGSHLGLAGAVQFRERG
jgi:autotransporter-associated beta strand protein